MTWKPVLVLLVSSALVAGCSAGSSASSGSASRGSQGSVDSASTAPVLSSVDLDHGSLVVDPVSGAAPAVTRAQAARVLAASEQGEGARTPVVAHVVIDVPVGHAPAGTSAHLDLPTAWVYTFPEWSRGGFCGSHVLPQHWASPSPAPVPDDASDSYAVIVDGTTGRGYLYAGAGTGPCGPRTVPDVLPIELQYSVPYTVHRAMPSSARITMTLPPCGTFQAFTPSFTTSSTTTKGARGMASAGVPSGTCAGTSTAFVESINGRFTESPHSAVGLICPGAYDADLGRPADCVPND